MSKMRVDYEKLQGLETKGLLEFEQHLFASLDREAAARREEKRKPKKRKRGRRY